MAHATRLTGQIVKRAELRMKHGAGLVSVRQALIVDDAGITDLDIARWLERGETLRVKGVSSQSREVTEDERLCVKLCELDEAKFVPTLIKAGEAMQEILVSSDPRSMSAKVKLITQLIQITAAPPGTEDVRAVGWSQDVMDGLTRAELRELDKIREARAQLATRETVIMLSAKARLEAEARARDAAAANELH